LPAMKFGGFLLGLLLLVAGCQLVLGDFELDDVKEGTCEPATVHCFGNVLQACDAEGTAWKNVAMCASDALCDAAKRECGRPTCADGERHCQDATFQICKSTRDGWTTVQACQTAGRCSAESGCTEQPCQAGQRQCNGAVIRTCRSDQSGWDEGDTCASAALCTKDGCTKSSCQPGEHQCSGAVLQLCNDALDGWTTVKSCDSAVLCDPSSGTCRTAGCTNPGAFRCSETGVLESCADDLTGWVLVAACQGAGFCDAVKGMCTTEPCTPGTYQCSGANLEVCNADSSGWRSVDSCETEGLCQQTLGLGSTTCAEPACEAGATQCVGAEPQVCNADRTAFKPNGPACATEELCNAGSGTCTAPLCDPGQTRCSGVQPEICNPGRTGYVSNGAPCASEALCNRTSGTCGDQKCVAGQLRCDPENPTYLQRCNDDLTDWDPTPCDICNTPELCSASLGAKSCDATSCQEPVCDAGVPHCGGSGTDAGKALEVCNAGRTGYTPCDACVTAELCAASSMKTPFSCTSMACTEPSCNDTDRWCGGSGNTGLYQCPNSRINTQATLLDTCDTNGLCELTRSNGETTCEEPTCALTDMWCGGTGNLGLYQCPSSRINTQAALLDTCATNGLCEATRSKRATRCDAPSCAVGDLWCGGSGNRSLYQCPSSRISSQAAVLDTCVTSGLCELTRSKRATKCETPACAVGATRCGGSDALTLQMCNSDRTDFTACDTCATADLCADSLGTTSCNSSACLACATDEARCNAAGNYETCNADRTGFDVTDCMEAGCDETLGGCQ
jgi:hypothetical protein